MITFLTNFAAELSALQLHIIELNAVFITGEWADP